MSKLDLDDSDEQSLISMTRMKKFHLQGFTLMEVLIATGIFSGVIVAGIAFYAATLRNAESNRLQREVSQIGRTIVEDIERDIRQSYGSFDQQARIRQSFVIDNPSARPVTAASVFCPALAASGTVGNQLTLYRQDQSQASTMKTVYRLIDGTVPGSLTIERARSSSSDFGQTFGPESSEVMLPTEVALFEPDSFCFRGYYPTAGSVIQPYIEIRLQVKNADTLTARASRKVVQQFQTLVTSRDTQVKY